MRLVSISLLAVTIFACAETPPGYRRAGAEPAEPTAGPDAAGAARVAPWDSAAGAPVAPSSDPDPAGGWTVGRIEGAADTGSAVLMAVRTARHDGYDRVALEFAGDLLPGYRAEYVDSPQQQCGSGDELRVPGSAWIRLDLEPARAHDEEGRATVADRAPRPGLPNLIELRVLCDFEGQVTWVLGLRSPEPFRILRLERPARLVLDIRH